MAFSECLYHDLKNINANIQVAVVCPGGVKTNILDSKQDETLSTLNNDQQHFLIKFAKLIKKGMSPDTVAEIIFAGLEHKQFYIFTHPEMISIVEQRLQAVVNQNAPQPLVL
jgi:short-subunit dehydrogenase